MPSTNNNYSFGPKIGIIGLGMVGNAIDQSLGGFYPTVKIDTDPLKNCTGTYDEILDCEAIFVCVPSPQSKDGTCDTSILETTLEKLKSFKNVIISKTTAPPGVYGNLSKRYPNLVHAPEFLTAANSVQDYMNGRFAIIGGSVLAYVNEAQRIILYTQPGLEQISKCTIEEAALTKYAINTFLATKVVFMNELYLLAKSAGVSYDVVAQQMNLDKRIGQSHMKVPGADGLGFDGMCFPKDTTALLKYADSKDINLTVLRQAVETNKLLRKKF